MYESWEMCIDDLIDYFDCMGMSVREEHKDLPSAIEKNKQEILRLQNENFIFEKRLKYQERNRLITRHVQIYINEQRDNFRKYEDARAENQGSRPDFVQQAQ